MKWIQPTPLQLRCVCVCVGGGEENIICVACFFSKIWIRTHTYDIQQLFVLSCDGAFILVRQAAKSLSKQMMISPESKPKDQISRNKKSKLNYFQCQYCTQIIIYFLCASLSRGDKYRYPTQRNFKTNIRNFVLNDVTCGGSVRCLGVCAAGCAESALQWRHNELDNVSNHQSPECLLNRLFKAQIKGNLKTPRHWPLWGEFTETGKFPAHSASNAENVSIWLRHHGFCQTKLIIARFWYLTMSIHINHYVDIGGIIDCNAHCMWHCWLVYGNRSYIIFMLQLIRLLSRNNDSIDLRIPTNADDSPEKEINIAEHGIEYVITYARGLVHHVHFFYYYNLYN